MTAAIFAAREGAQVVLLEHKDRVGKKILSTGNGRCNLSNRLQEPFCYRSGQPDFPWKALGPQVIHGGEYCLSSAYCIDTQFLQDHHEQA